LCGDCIAFVLPQPTFDELVSGFGMKLPGFIFERIEFQKQFHGFGVAVCGIGSQQSQDGIECG